MPSRANSPNSKSDASLKSGCGGCVLRELGLCSILIGAGLESPLDRPPLPQFEKTVAARLPLFRAEERFSNVPILCEGWAAIVAHLPNGRRQILSFLLPGDFISASLLFEETLHHAAETITPVCYRSFARAELRELLFAHPKILENVASACIREKQRLEDLAIDLGRRRADARLARLILSLRERMATRGRAPSRVFNFPLRQVHIADALGMTQVHVNRVIKRFHQNGLIDLQARSLRILNEKELQRLANK